MGNRGRPRRKKTNNKEEIAEDWCFVCKEGGMLRICDYKNCLKVYHHVCVGRDESFLNSDERWLCNWHFCHLCGKTAKFHCFSCPFAVCGHCLCDVKFAVVKGMKGLCNLCLGLITEDKGDLNSNEVQVDSNYRETSIRLFKEYWELVKEKEGLTSEHLHSASRLLKDGKNYEEDANDFEDESDHLIVSDYADLSDNQVQSRKKKKAKLPLSKRNGKTKKMEFSGWASKQLTEFLTSIGKNAVQELSQQDVATIVVDYCKENKLFHPEIKKKVICDEKLQLLLGRKSVNRNVIHKLLTIHFAENFELSEELLELNSKESDGETEVPCKRQRKSSPDRKFEEKTVALTPQHGYLAAIVSSNIKLVYLKRSLVQELAEQVYSTFRDKMIGSFVRVKSDPHDYSQKNSHMLVKVKDVKETSMDEDVNSIYVLQVSNMLNDVPVCKLSDDDFTEEECEDLFERMRAGRLERPTVVELEEKARSLHADITKHWIPKRLGLLQNLIDRANEKGWRKELSEHMDEMRLLQTSSEQSRLIHEIPEVVVDVAEPAHASEDCLREDHEKHKASSESTPILVSKVQTSVLENDEVSCFPTEGMDAAATNEKHLVCPIPEGKKQQDKFPDCQSGSVYEKQPGDAAEEKLNHPAAVEKKIKVIELSDDDEEDAKVVRQETVSLEDRDWYVVSPTGAVWGPHPLTAIRKWSSGCSEFQFKVMRCGQRPEEAVPLTDAIRKYFKSQ